MVLSPGVLVEDVPWLSTWLIFSGAVLVVLWCVGVALAVLAAIPQVVWRMVRLLEYAERNIIWRIIS